MQLASRIAILVGVATAGVPAQGQEPTDRTVVETTGNGVRIERQVVDEGSGEVSHGLYRSFREDGTPIEEGRYDLGVEDGPWVYYHPNGQVRARGDYKEGKRVGPWEFFHPDGSLSAEGVYQRGLRRGRWTYLDEKGRKTGETGTYTPLFEEWDNGRRKLEGEHRFKFKHGVWRWFRPDGSLACEGHYANDVPDGPWTWTWKNGTPIVQGAFEHGLRTGDWVFRHPDGSVDPGFLSARYEGGDVVGRPEVPPPELAGIRLADLDDPRPPDGLTGPDLTRLEELVRLVRSGTEAERAAVRAEILDWEVTILPSALFYLKRLDLEREDDAREAANLYREIVLPASNGHAFPWRDGSDPEAIAADRLAIVRWLSVWRLSGECHALWREARATRPADVPALVEGVLRAKLLDAFLEDPWTAPSETLREESVATFPLDLASRESLLAKYGGDGTREALDRALVWLAAHQEEDGRWDCDGFVHPVPAEGSTAWTEAGFGQHIHDVAMTGLALSAFLSAGNSLLDGPHRKVVQDAVTWLRGAQDPPTGLFELPERNTAFFYCHVIATWAMADAVRDSTNPMLRRRVQAAVDAIRHAQNPGAGWHYGSEPTGESDTSSTIWATGALLMARRAGFEVDDAAFQGALAWFTSMTDGATGRTGYQQAGSPSVRTPENLDYPFDAGETLSAGALWCRLLLGQRLDTHPVLERQARLLLTRSPEWLPGAYANDMTHWYFGSLAMFQVGDPYWSTWNEAMKRALVEAQRKEGPYAGSWDPVGPWGYLGGRVYSTAVCALTLAVYHRYQRQEP